MLSSTFNNIVKGTQSIKNAPQTIKKSVLKRAEFINNDATNAYGYLTGTKKAESAETKEYDDNYKLYNLKIIKSKKDGKVLLLDTDVKKIYKAGEYYKADSGEVLNDYGIVTINGIKSEYLYDSTNIPELIKNADIFKTKASRKRTSGSGFTNTKSGGRRPRRKTVKRNRTRRVKK